MIAALIGIPFLLSVNSTSAQGLKHYRVEQSESQDGNLVKTEKLDPKVQEETSILSDIPDNLLKLPEEFEKGVKHYKTVDIKSVIDPLRLLTNDDEIIYLEGLFIPNDEKTDLEAKASLETLIKEKTVELYICKKPHCKTKDRFGHLRVHAVIKDDKTWLQAALISLGQAKVRTRNDWPIFNENMFYIESYARAHRTGLWLEETHDVLNADKIDDSFRGFALVQGTVKSSATFNNKLYINFGSNWKTDFTIVVPSEVRRKFTKQGINLQNITSQVLRVRGWVDHYNGPFVEIDHPEQVEWLSKQDN